MIPATLFMAICFASAPEDCTIAEPKFPTMAACYAAIPNQIEQRRRLGMQVIEALCLVEDDRKP